MPMNLSTNLKPKELKLTEKTQEQINADEAVRKYVNQSLDAGLPVVAICADNNGTEQGAA